MRRPTMLRALALGALLVVGCDDGPAPAADGGPTLDGEVPDACEGVTECTTEATSCTGDTLVTCAPNADGCLIETELDCSSMGETCDDSGAAAMCAAPDPCAGIPGTEICDTEGRTCDGDSLEICAENADGCLVLEVTDCAASEGGECDASGAMPMCVLPADPCDGIADACTTEGTSCTDDTLVTCAPDAFGCLVETATDCSARAGGTCDGSASPAACTFTGDPCDGVTECAAAGQSCDGSELVICEADAYGCLVETRVECTDTTFGFCDADATPAPVCSTAATDPCMGVTECAAEGQTCSGDDLVVCAVNAFGCRVETTTDCTSTSEVCGEVGGSATCDDVCVFRTTCPQMNYCAGDEVVACSADADGCLIEDSRTTCPYGCDAAACNDDYFEDFESGDGGWTSGGTTTSWAYGMADGPDGSPTNLWATNPAGDYGNNEDGYVESPAFDFGSLSADPTLRFDHRFVTEDGYDEGWVEISVDGGTSWTKLGTAGDGLNWYNDSTNDWWEDTSDGWRLAQIAMTGAAGNADVRLRFYFASDTSNTDDGIYFDNVGIYDELVDLAVTGVNTVPGSPCADATTAVEVTVQNLGVSAVSTFDVTFTADGGIPVTETVTQTIAPLDTFVYTSTATFDLSAAGAHSVTATALLTGDTIATNDTLTNAAVLSAQPLGANASVTTPDVSLGAPGPDGSSCSGGSGLGYWYSVTVPATSVTTVTAVATTGSTDLVIELVDSCGATDCLDYADSEIGDPETLELANGTASPVTYYVVLEAYSSSASGTVDVTTTTAAIVCGDGTIEGGEECDDGGTATGDGCSDICQIESGWTCSGEPSSCMMIPPGETCGTPIVISASGSFTGSTATFTDDYEPESACTGFGNDGNDVVYEVALAAGETLDATLTPDSTWDPAIYVLGDCSATTCLGGVDDVGTGSAETLSYTATSAGTVYLIVDSYSPSHSGPYTLDVTLTP